MTSLGVLGVLGVATVGPVPIVDCAIVHGVHGAYKDTHHGCIQPYLSHAQYKCTKHIHNNPSTHRRHTVIGFAWDRCDDDKLRETFGVGREVFGQLIDVQEVARRLGYVRTGLANLAQTILRYSLTKDKWITRSDWDARSLNAKQLRYGAMDAVVTAALYRTLRSLHNEPIPCETCEELLGVEPAELLHVYVGGC